MEERTGIVTMRGNPPTLVGHQVKVGDTAPDFIVIDTNLTPVRFSSYRGKLCIISSVPLLARAVFLVDQGGIIRYVQLVKEVTNEPDYEAIWGALKKLS